MTESLRVGRGVGWCVFEGVVVSSCTKCFTSGCLFSVGSATSTGGVREVERIFVLCLFASGIPKMFTGSHHGAIGCFRKYAFQFKLHWVLQFVLSTACMPGQLNRDSLERAMTTEMDKGENFGPCGGGVLNDGDSVTSGDISMDEVVVVFRQLWRAS